MNKYNPNLHHRHSVRLKNYDYAQEGFYFITICVNKHQCVFGNIANGKMCLNKIGEIVRNEWLMTAELRHNVQLHNFVVMPNHFHGILEIVQNELNGNYVLHDEYYNMSKNAQNELDGNYVLHDEFYNTPVGARRALPLHAHIPTHAQIPIHTQTNYPNRDSKTWAKTRCHQLPGHSNRQ